MKDFKITISTRTSANAAYVIAAVAYRVALVPAIFRTLVKDGAEGIKLEHTSGKAELFGYGTGSSGTIKRNKFKLYREGLEVQAWAKECYDRDVIKGEVSVLAELVLAGMEKNPKAVRSGRKFGTKAALARAESLSMRKKRAMGRNIAFATLHPDEFRLQQGRMFSVK